MLYYACALVIFIVNVFIVLEMKLANSYSEGSLIAGVAVREDANLAKKNGGGGITAGMHGSRKRVGGGGGVEQMEDVHVIAWPLAGDPGMLSVRVCVACVCARLCARVFLLLALHAPTTPVDFQRGTVADFAVVHVRVQKNPACLCVFVCLCVCVCVCVCVVN